MRKSAPPSVCPSRSAATGGSIPADAMSEPAVCRNRWNVNASNGGAGRSCSSACLKAPSIAGSHARSRNPERVHGRPVTVGKTSSVPPLRARSCSRRRLHLDRRQLDPVGAPVLREATADVEGGVVEVEHAVGEPEPVVLPWRRPGRLGARGA